MGHSAKRWFACALVLGLCSCGDEGEEAKPSDIIGVDVATDARENQDTSDSEPDGEVSTDVDGTVDVDPPLPTCETGFLDPVAVGQIPAELPEISGLALAASGGALWAHNDSGDSATLYAFSTEGTLLASLSLEGVTAQDFEDMAAGPCPEGEGRCLWVADIGDNDARRTNLKVHAVPEPDLTDRPPGSALTSERVWSYPVTYPDGPMDAEGFAVDIDGKGFTIFEKAPGAQARVMRTRDPLVDGETVAMDVAVTAPLPSLVTAADLHPAGERLLLRTYFGVFLVDIGGGLSSLLTADYEAVNMFSEPQGEAIVWDEGGTGFYTGSEDRDGGDAEPVLHHSCDL